jgi:hypothetical protein
LWCVTVVAVLAVTCGVAVAPLMVPCDTLLCCRGCDCGNLHYLRPCGTVLAPLLCTVLVVPRGALACRFWALCVALRCRLGKSCGDVVELWCCLW